MRRELRVRRSRGVRSELAGVVPSQRPPRTRSALAPCWSPDDWARPRQPDMALGTASSTPECNEGALRCLQPYCEPCIEVLDTPELLSVVIKFALRENGSSKRLKRDLVEHGCPAVFRGSQQVPQRRTDALFSRLSRPDEHLAPQRRLGSLGRPTPRPLKHSHLKKHTAVARATAGKPRCWPAGAPARDRAPAAGYPRRP